MNRLLRTPHPGARPREVAFIVFVVACVTMVAVGNYTIFFHAEPWSVHGVEPVALSQFGAGSVVSSAFVADRRLSGISLRFAADQPSSLRVSCALRQLADRNAGAEDNPNQYTELRRWIQTLNIAAGDHWVYIPFSGVGEITDNWYRFDIQLLGAEANQPRPTSAGGSPAVRLLAAGDTPPHGRKLWIDGVRQSGSPLITAHGSAGFGNRAPPLAIPIALQAALFLFVAWRSRASVMRALDRSPQRAMDGRVRLMLFYVAATAYLAVVFFWLDRTLYLITGDEPHYLVAADALVSRHSLDLRGVYEHGVWEALGPGQWHTVAAGDILRPGHGLAVTFLVALPYALFGVAGAKAVLAILSAVLTSAFYPTLLGITRERAWSIAAATVAALSLPYTMAAGQIYPDLLAGLLRAYLLYEIARGFPAGDRRWGRLIAYAAAAGLLPWLHHRHLVVAALFAVAFAVRFTSAEAERTATGWTFRAFTAGLRSNRLLVPSGVIIASCVGEVVYTLTMYGTLIYPDTPRFLGWYSIMIALGLHLDQFHGMMFQNPLFFIALAGVPRFSRRTPFVFALWCMVYALTVLPVCMHPSNYGGWSFAGRYGWDVAPLWLFPLGHGLAYALEWGRWVGRTALIAMLIAAATAQIVFAFDWLRIDGFLIQDSTRPLWMLNTLYGSLRSWLPLFSRVDVFRALPPNWIWVAVAVLLVVTGVLAGTRRPRLAAWPALAMVLAVAPLVAMPQQDERLVLPAADLFRTTGRDDGRARVASGGRDGAGFLIFGPYLPLPSGCYDAELFYAAEPAADRAKPIWDLVDAGRRVDGGELPFAAPDGVFHTRIGVPPGHALRRFEFRVWFPGSGRIRIERLIITPNPGCNAGSQTTVTHAR